MKALTWMMLVERILWGFREELGTLFMYEAQSEAKNRYGDELLRDLMSTFLSLLPATCYESTLSPSLTHNSECTTSTNKPFISAVILPLTFYPSINRFSINENCEITMWQKLWKCEKFPINFCFRHTARKILFRARDWNQTFIFHAIDLHFSMLVVLKYRSKCERLQVSVSILRH